MDVRTALVTGGNRGIGFEVCRQLAKRGLRVVLAARDRGRGEAAASELRSQGLEVCACVLDVSADDAVGAAARTLADAGVHVDVLVNNAGVYLDGELLTLSFKTLRASFATNFFGALWCCQAFVPAMTQAGYGRVVNVSSGYGALSDGLEGPPAYSLSKAALNALTVKLARAVPDGVKVNSVDPGWVRTRMGGKNATDSVEQGADTIVWAATLPDDGPSGGFFRNRRPIPW